MSLTVRRLVACSVIAALYAAVTVLLAPVSYGPWQFRLSEVLCILPFFAPVTSWGLFVGCLVANLLSPVGLLDIVFGPLATLGASLCMAAIAKRRGTGSFVGALLACLMPVLWNAVVIGAILALTIAEAGDTFFSAFVLFGLQVGLGEAGVLYLIGLPLMRWLPKSGAVMKLVSEL